MNAQTITRYQSPHRIKPVAAVRAFGPITACQVDGIRVHPNHGRGAPWRHDAFEVKEAAAFRTYVERHELG